MKGVAAKAIVAMIVLAFLILGPSFITVAKASEVAEIKYDDGSSEDQWDIAPQYKVGVMFTKNGLPYSENLLVTVRIYLVWAEEGQQLTMCFLDSTFNEIRAPVFTPPLQAGWNDIDVSSYGLVMQDDFLIAFQWLQPDGSRTWVWLGYDLNGFPDNNNHGYEYNPWIWPFPYWHCITDPTGGGGEIGNWMIRVVVANVAPSANLKGVSLQGANLQGANLAGANLAGANLAGANLQGTNLQDANLRNADFSGANVGSANFAGANLKYANFNGATLTGTASQPTNFNGANLQYATFTGAICGSPNYITAANANLKNVKDVPPNAIPPL